MLKILAIAGVVLVVVVAGILIYAATKPNDFRVQRSIVIKAPPEKIFALISDLHGWASWSPYEKKDPAMKRSFGGAPSGKGAIYEWDGNKNVGKGRMEVIENTPPFEAHNTAEFTLVPQGDSTTVTWAMYGPSPYMAKVMGTIMNMDKMIGTDFADGLVNLKALAEK